MNPKRIQRKRTKGWRMPEGAIYVGRPSRWGNPWRLGDSIDAGLGLSPNMLIPLDTPVRVILPFRAYAVARREREPAWLAPLRGHDLVCWCPLDQPCHADVLLEVANR